MQRLKDGCRFAENQFRIKKNPWQQSASATKLANFPMRFGNRNDSFLERENTCFFAPQWQPACSLLNDWGYCQGWRVLYNGGNCVFAPLFFFLLSWSKDHEHRANQPFESSSSIIIASSAIAQTLESWFVHITVALKGLSSPCAFIISHIHQTWVNCCTNSHLGGELRKIASMRITHPLVTIWIALSE